MKKQRIENLTNEMIEILIIDLQEENATENSQTIKFKHYQDSALRNTINKVRAATSAEWYFNKNMNDDIARDEVYASFYESLLIIAEDVDIEKIEIENTEFVNEVTKMTINKSKLNLIPDSKKNRDGSIIKMYETTYSPISDSDDETANSPLEDILAGQDTEILMGAKQEKMNHFLKWFESNKTKVLTKKQREFIKDQSNYTDKDKSYKMRKRISERVSKAYEEQYGAASPRIAILMDQKRTIEKILDAKSFRTAYDKYKDEDFIIDAITEHVNLKYLQAFNKGSNEINIIKTMRIALFKKLGEVITMIEANK